MTKPRIKLPTLEIENATINHLADLGDRHRGIALRWMIATLRGDLVTVEEESAQLGQRFASVCAKLKPMLDPQKFEAGLIVIQFVSDKLEHQRRISKVRAEASALRKSNGARMARPKQMPLPASQPALALVPAPVAKAKPKLSVKSETPTQTAQINLKVCPIQVERLQAMGVTAKQALATIGKFTKEYGEAAVAHALDRMQQRKLAKPIAYLETSLENSRREHAEAVPLYIKGDLPTNGSSPRGIKRHQRVPPGSPYQFLGWTCANHPRAGDGVRRKIWRTDSGSLAYKRAEINETIPDFNEDAGCYEEE